MWFILHGLYLKSEEILVQGVKYSCDRTKYANMDDPTLGTRILRNIVKLVFTEFSDTTLRQLFN